MVENFPKVKKNRDLKQNLQNKKRKMQTKPQLNISQENCLKNKNEIINAGRRQREIHLTRATVCFSTYLRSNNGCQ